MPEGTAAASGASRPRGGARASTKPRPDDVAVEVDQAGSPTHPGQLCEVGFCPICMAVTALGDVKPEAVDHLIAAGRELLLALKTVIDARVEGFDQPTKLERIRIE